MGALRITVKRFVLCRHVAAIGRRLARLPRDTDARRPRRSDTLRCVTDPEGKKYETGPDARSRPDAISRLAVVSHRMIPSPPELITSVPIGDVVQPADMLARGQAAARRSPVSGGPGDALELDADAIGLPRNAPARRPEQNPWSPEPRQNRFEIEVARRFGSESQRSRRDGRRVAGDARVGATRRHRPRARALSHPQQRAVSAQIATRLDAGVGCARGVDHGRDLSSDPCRLCRSDRPSPMALVLVDAPTVRGKHRAAPAIAEG